LEALVFAERAALRAADTIDKKSPLDKVPVPSFEISLNENKQTEELTQRLQRAVWDGAGIVRSNQCLHAALDQIKSIAKEAENISPLTPATIELKNMTTVASLIVQSAMLRKESRGLHYNEDYPNTDDKNFLKDTILQK
jgi:L-aspartate oxidase